MNFLMPDFFSLKFDMNSPLQPRLGMIDILSNMVCLRTYLHSELTRSC
jgi:hypothetical protein